MGITLYTWTPAKKGLKRGYQWRICKRGLLHVSCAGVGRESVMDKNPAVTYPFYSHSLSFLSFSKFLYTWLLLSRATFLHFKNYLYINFHISLLKHNNIFFLLLFYFCWHLYTVLPRIWCAITPIKGNVVLKRKAILLQVCPVPFPFLLFCAPPFFFHIFTYYLGEQLDISVFNETQLQLINKAQVFNQVIAPSAIESAVCVKKEEGRDGER